MTDHSSTRPIGPGRSWAIGFCAVFHLRTRPWLPSKLPLAPGVSHALLTLLVVHPQLVCTALPPPRREETPLLLPFGLSLSSLRVCSFQASPLFLSSFGFDPGVSGKAAHRIDDGSRRDGVGARWRPRSCAVGGARAPTRVVVRLLPQPRHARSAGARGTRRGARRWTTVRRSAAGHDRRRHVPVRAATRRGC